MEAKLKRASPPIVLIGNFPVRFLAVCLALASRLAAGAIVSTFLLASVSAEQQPPDPLNRHYSAAQTFQLGGDLDRAESEYHQVLALALQRMGNLVAAEKNDSEDAVHLLEAAVAADPTYADAHIDLAMAYFRAGHLDKASAQAAEVVKSDPRNARALQLLGNVEFAQGNFAPAAEHLHTALGQRRAGRKRMRFAGAKPGPFLRVEIKQAHENGGKSRFL